VPLAGALMLHFVADAGPIGYQVTNLITSATDSDLINPWGVSLSGGSPMWVSDNGTGKATLYAINPATQAIVKQGLIVSIPGDGSVTGQAFNSAAASGAFNSDNFLFVSEDGTVSGWRGALGTAAEVLKTADTANVYKGSTLVTTGGNVYLLEANFRSGAIDVMKGSAAAPALAGNFTDPGLPAGYAPFNVQNIGGTIYVTYALQDGAKHDEVPGAGNGFVSKFDVNGNFLGRVASNGPLNAPWGVALAPASFGDFAGDLLIGNFGDGRINAYNPSGGPSLGPLTNPSGTPIAIDGLWALSFGNNGNGGSANSLYFTAGPASESQGVLGVINAAPEPGTWMMIGAALPLLALLRRRR
jgi:uncharacterized protein (TIGR03118 family)